MKQGPSVKRVVIAVGLLLLLILFLGNLLARRLLIFSPDDLVYARETDYTLSTNVDHGVAVFANNINLNADVDGHAFLAGYTVAVDGTVDNDLTALGETVNFAGVAERHAVFAGDTIRLNGVVEDETVVFASRLIIEGGSYDGGIIACVESLENSSNAEVRDCDGEAAQLMLNRAGSQLASVWFVFTLNNPQMLNVFDVLLPIPMVLFITAFAALLVVMFPQSISNMETAVRVSPVRMVTAGVLVSMLMVGITTGCLVVLAYVPLVGLLLIPLYLLCVLMYIIMLLGGWVTLTLILGNWVTRRFSQSMIPPILLAVIGGLVLTVLSYVLNWLPFGPLAALIAFWGVGFVGLGASYVTRLGRRSGLIF